MEVRRIVDWQVTNRILAVPGVSQVVFLFQWDWGIWQRLLLPVLRH